MQDLNKTTNDYLTKWFVFLPENSQNIFIFCKKKDLNPIQDGPNKKWNSRMRNSSIRPLVRIFSSQLPSLPLSKASSGQGQRAKATGKRRGFSQSRPSIEVLRAPIGQKIHGCDYL